MNNHYYLYLLAAVLAIYAVRALPMTLIRRDIKSPLSATGSTLSAAVGFVTAVVLAYVDGNLFRVAIGACVMVYLAEFFCI